MKTFQGQYNGLISKVKKENRGIKKLADHGKYFNIHHIRPRSLGGDDSDNNLIKLTHEEHFEAHRLLYLIHKDKNTRTSYKMAKAFIIMSSNFEVNAKEYSEAKATLYKVGVTEETSRKMGVWQVGNKNNMFGKGHLQTGNKNPMYNKGHLVAGDKNGMFGMTGDKNPFFGKDHSDEFKTKMKEKYGHVIIYKGVEYLSVREAHRITGDSRHFIKKLGTYINKKQYGKERQKS